MNNLHAVYATIGLVALLICCFIGMNKKYTPDGKLPIHGWVLFAVAIICLFISVGMKSNSLPTNIDNLSDQELYECIVDMDEKELDTWFAELTDRQQTRVFHVYMMNELATEAIEDAFENKEDTRY